MPSSRVVSIRHKRPMSNQEIAEYPDSCRAQMGADLIGCVPYARVKLGKGDDLFLPSCSEEFLPLAKLASEVDRLQFADLEEDLAAEEQADFTAPPESVTSDDSGFDFSASESDEEGADAVEVVSGAAPPTLLNAAALTNAAELANELGF